MVSLPPERIERLSAELADRDILLPPDLMLDLLLETRGDVALVAYHSLTGFKVELFPLRPGDELRATALQRRTWVELDPPLGGVYVHSAEDLILYKLTYYKLSAQTKHVRDIASLLLARGALLDYAYLGHWVQRLSLQAHWRALLSDARQGGAPVPD